MTNEEIEISAAAESERSTLRHLFELYAYDFSEILGLEVEEDGRFKVPDLGVYWKDPWRHPFLVRVRGKLAGFALVHTRSRLSGADGINDMAEFFVLRGHRRHGVGAQAAREIFRRFPGPWEVRERSSNHAAIAFWRRVIDRHTGGRFREVVWADDVWQGPVQMFAT